MKIRICLLGSLLAFSSQAFALFGALNVAGSQFDSVVTLQLADPEHSEYGFFCSGILVAPTRIVTTGHCIAQMGNEVYDDVHHLARFPQVVAVKFKMATQVVVRVTMAPTYFEHHGLDGEDLAVLELALPFPGALPMPIIAPQDLKVGMPLTLVARGKMVQTALKSVTNFGRNITVLQTETSTSGICRGDSGGALAVNKNGQWKLAGVLIYEGEDDCSYIRNVSYFPKARF